MGESTGIAWTDHTFNIAWGCFKVSPGCKNCYADTYSARRGQSGIWGPPADTARRVFGAKHWNDPLKWNRDAEKAGKSSMVFSSSMCDIFENHPTIIGELAKLWPLIRATPWLDWQLLTKRHDRIAQSLPSDWGSGYPNVWLGVSVENQEYADLRIPSLLQVPARVHFISYEPALGPVDLSAYVDMGFESNGPAGWIGQTCLEWVIYGGESGPGYRKEDKQWARDVHAQCQQAGVPFFHKQSSAPRTEMGIELDGKIVREFPDMYWRRDDH